MKILYLENHEHFAEAVLREFLYLYEVEVVPTIEEATTKVLKFSYDLALVDYDLDDGKGDEFIFFLKQNNIKLPSIAVSSHETGNSALLSAGAVSTCDKMNFSKICEIIENLFL